MIRKKLLSVCLALALCLSLLPATALAVDATVYGTIEVGGVALTNSETTPTVYAITNADTGVVTIEGATAENYNIMWDGSTLTLRNATIEQAKEYSDKNNEKIAVYRQSGDLAIALVGENTVDAPGNGTAASCGINLGNGSLSISGADGASLAVYGGPTEHGNSCGIYANGTITIDSGTVTVTGESASAASYGICASGAVTINGGSVTAASGEAGGNSCGIYTSNSVIIEDGTLNAASGKAGGNSCGIYASNSVTIEDGTVNATGGNAVRDSYGIYASSFTINGGTVVATGGEATNRYSMGVRADGSITIHDGVVTATGDTAHEFSYGMNTSGNFTINGGIVTATTGEAQLSYGIRGGTLTINSGTVTATAGNAVRTGTYSYSFGFCAQNIIINSGTVTATAGNAGSGTINNCSSGFFAFDNLTISGGDVTGIGGTGELSCGIGCNDILTITGGTVVGKGGPLAGTNIQYSAGVNGMGEVKISGGTVTGTGGDTEAGDSFGICTGDTTSYNVVTVSIKDATVTATGGTATNGKSSGISATNTGADVKVTIENAAVTATGGSAGTGSYGILAETTGTDKSADVTINGHSVVRLNTTGDHAETIHGTTVNRNSGIVFENGEGTVYGTVTLQEDLTVAAGETLTIPEDATLTIPDGTTLTIGQGGTLTGNVNGNPVIYAVTVLTDGNGTASASEIYATANDTVTLTATPNSGYHFERWEVVSGGVTVENNAFTMPAQPVTVKAIFDRNSSGSSSYTITTPDAEHGTVAASPSRASSGTTVTITVTPDEGYELGELIVTDANGDEVDLTRESATKYTFEMPRSRVTVAASFVESAPEPLPFDDVDDGDWFADAVRFVYENGMMNGTGDTTFAPDATTSRSMIVTILYRLEGEPVVDDAMDFSDVAGDAWYTDAVRWAAGEGIVGGYGNGLFGSDDAVTREQLAAILYRYAVYKGYDVSIGEDTNLLSYDDFEDLSEYAIPAMQWACGTGIVNGTSESTLTPQGEAERAQVAAMLMRFCESIVQ